MVKPRRWVLAWSAALFLCAVGLDGRYTAMPLPSSVHGVGRPLAEWPIQDLVAVTEDIASPLDGCDAISILSLDAAGPTFRGPTNASVGRLAASPDLSTLVATPLGRVDGFLYFLQQSLSPGDLWHAKPQIGGAMASLLGGVAIMPDGETLLVAGNGSGSFAYGPPFWVGKYKISEMVAGRVGAEHGRYTLGATAAEILASRSGNSAHVLTADATVETIDVATMTRSMAPIKVQPVGEGDSWMGKPLPAWGYLGLTHAALTGDERILVTNRWDSGELNVADLAARKAVTVVTASRLNGGVAVNRGWVNPGLWAVHAIEELIVYRFEPPATLETLARLSIRPPRVAPGGNGPVPSIAWSGSGDRLIVATDQGPAEFQVVAVQDGGHTLVPGRLLTACPAPPNDRGEFSNAANDIETANGFITPPAPTATATTTSVPLPEFTPTTAPSSTPTPTVADQTVTLYLPLLSANECRSGQGRMDVVLVIDASLSMLQPSSAGRTKLQAAIEAAATWLDHLQLSAGDQAAIVAFNADARLLSPLSGDRQALDLALSAIQAAQLTRLGQAVEVARAELMSVRHRVGNRPVIIVLSDGYAEPEPVDLALEAAARAKSDGTTIFTIGLGNDVDVKALTEMASRPEDFYRAPDAEDLAKIYHQIATSIPCRPPGSFGTKTLDKDDPSPSNTPDNSRYGVPVVICPVCK